MAAKCICAWCKKVLTDGDEPVTHGICPACLAEQIAQIGKKK